MSFDRVKSQRELHFDIMRILSAWLVIYNHTPPGHLPVLLKA